MHASLAIPPLSSRGFADVVCSDLLRTDLFHAGARRVLRELSPVKLNAQTQWRIEAKCRPGPTLKVPPFQPLKFAYKI